MEASLEDHITIKYLPVKEALQIEGISKMLLGGGCLSCQLKIVNVWLVITYIACHSSERCDFTAKHSFGRALGDTIQQIALIIEIDEATSLRSEIEDGK